MILKAEHLPDINQLLLTLKGQFPYYKVYQFNSNPLKSIIVQKSTIIGAQLTLRGNEIMVDACCPNIFISSLLGALSAIFPPYINFEMKITDFLKNKYN
ncbi:hypothetical protein EL17_21730 [Anditalea andensis]|uniref:Uncharacterized protein n=1 Tax=Anditalea andensis TaxID=1048983 RepID=A0A074KSB2_9BACT|nr:hypothetical protein EL17_21730 [Anditalea andensis]